VAIPKLLFINSRVKCDTDVLDPAHNALNNVTVTLTKYSKRWTFWWGNVSEETTETLNTGDSNFVPIDRYGYYEIDANFAKPGYQPLDAILFRGPNPEQYAGYGLYQTHRGPSVGPFSDSLPPISIDVTTTSRAAIVLTPVNLPPVQTPAPPTNSAAPPGARYETPR
jgi:hypothetical protein